MRTVLEDLLGQFGDLATLVASLTAHGVERRHCIHTVSSHQNADGPFDRHTVIERMSELADQLLLLGV